MVARAGTCGSRFFCEPLFVNQASDGIFAPFLLSGSAPWKRAPSIVKRRRHPTGLDPASHLTIFDILLLLHFSIALGHGIVL